MQILLIVLNQTEKLNKLLIEFLDDGISGATILKSSGLIKTLLESKEQYPQYDSVKHIIDDETERGESNTIVMALSDEKIEKAKAAVRRVVGDLTQPDTAIMLTIPAISAEGLGF